MPGLPASVDKVVVHPLVLLSVVDHFNRMTKIGSYNRVVGILLGAVRNNNELDISNSFGVPFDEDSKDRSVWFLDHDYLENLYAMFKKVNAREKIVGWYHTGPKLHPNDIAINELIKKYNPNAVLVIIDVKPKDMGLPTDAYIEVEEVHDDGTPTSKTFEHLPSEMGAEEAEEVGVEHLLRDIKDTTVSSLSQRITDQLMGLRGLLQNLKNLQRYLNNVSEGRLPMNYQIIYQLQDIFNLLPDVHLESFVKSVFVKTNDEMLVIYIASMVRAIIALHNLIRNKISLFDGSSSGDQGHSAADKKNDKSSTDGGPGDKKKKKAAGDEVSEKQKADKKSK